jgi:hypothetical protein
MPSTSRHVCASDIAIMAEGIVGIIQVPLYSFKFQPNVGREKDHAIVKRLSSLFSTTQCKPQEWENHVKGYITPEIHEKILSALGKSEDEFHRTIQSRKYPRLRGLRKFILCFEGRQRIAAAWQTFGKTFWWTVKLYIDTSCQQFSHETKYPDGEIYWNVRNHRQRREIDRIPGWRFELSSSKDRILRALLKEIPSQIPGQPTLVHKAIVEALDLVFSFSGMRKQFRLGTMLKVFSLHCPEQVEHNLRRIANCWMDISDGHPLYIDHDTIVRLQRRVPSNKEDRRYIRTMFHEKQILRLVKDPSLRERMKRKILSLKMVIPSVDTFHENMILFSIGAKILTKFVMNEDGSNHSRNGGESLFHNLDRHWQAPDVPRLEAGEGEFRRIVSLDESLARKMVFLSSVRRFPYLSNHSPLQDKRKRYEHFPVGEDSAYIFQLCHTARTAGYSTPKIIHTLATLPPLPRPDILQLDRNLPAREWRCGKPSIRSFLDLQETSFLPTLQEANAEEEITPAFVMKDFLESFFGSDSFMIDAEEVPSDLPPPPGGMDVDMTQPVHHAPSAEPHLPTNELGSLQAGIEQTHMQESQQHQVPDFAQEQPSQPHAPPSGRVQDVNETIRGQVQHQDPPHSQVEEASKPIPTPSAGKTQGRAPARRDHTTLRDGRFNPLRRPENTKKGDSKRSVIPPETMTVPSAVEAMTPRRSSHSSAAPSLEGAKGLSKRSPITPPDPTDPGMRIETREPSDSPAEGAEELSKRSPIIPPEPTDPGIRAETREPSGSPAAQGTKELLKGSPIPPEPTDPDIRAETPEGPSESTPFPVQSPPGLSNQSLVVSPEPLTAYPVEIEAPGRRSKGSSTSSPRNTPETTASSPSDPVQRTAPNPSPNEIQNSNQTLGPDHLITQAIESPHSDKSTRKRPNAWSHRSPPPRKRSRTMLTPILLQNRFRPNRGLLPEVLASPKERFTRGDSCRSPIQPPEASSTIADVTSDSRSTPQRRGQSQNDPNLFTVSGPSEMPTERQSSIPRMEPILGVSQNQSPNSRIAVQNTASSSAIKKQKLTAKDDQGKATQTSAAWRKTTRLRPPIEILDPSDLRFFEDIPLETPISTKDPKQGLSRRAPIQPPEEPQINTQGSGTFRVPSMSSSGGSERGRPMDPQGCGRFRVPSMSSSGGSERGRPMDPQGSGTFRVPGTSSSEGSERGRPRQRPTHPPLPGTFPDVSSSEERSLKRSPSLVEPSSAATAYFEIFSQSKVAYPGENESLGSGNNVTEEE